jgi:hypothetical protein
MAFNTYIGDVIAIFQLGEKIWNLGWSEKSKVGAYRSHPVAFSIPRALCPPAVLAELSATCRVGRGKYVEFWLLTFCFSRTGIQFFL